MGQASRAKRKRAAVRSAKRSRHNNWWYILTVFVLIAGVALIVYARMTQPSPVGPYILDQVNQTNPHNKDSHWHAALGVYNCDHWMGDPGSNGVWQWPAATPSGTPARVGNTSVYAGMHSHDDGIIHMEPQVSEEAGRHATVGKYFEYGGWSLSSTGFNFLGTKVQNGDKCNGKPGTVQWALGKWDGTTPPGAQKYAVGRGNPADYKLYNGDIVIIAFLPEGKSVVSLGNPPSLKNLPNAAGVETPPGQTATSGSTLPATTPTTATGATSPTTKAAAATPTTKKP